ncbi:hypothetical protein SCHPADRAFT_887117 [Schizopora paradoxa]|uniref:Uncharacterized protein n=1 Tax=Schizopora paradoxa TaxID=27342 RepID=A0A0H2S6L6_9AGAM|nr:hypothetical protein SCHPADRAFT_887117 [Schizopora paradoxa]
MEKSISDHVNDAIECLDRIDTMIAKAGDSKTVSGVPLVSILKDAVHHLKLAKDAAFNQHVYFALSPDIFNPFNLPSVERSFSRFSLGEASRVLILKKHMNDPDPTVELPPPEERMGRNIVVYTISSGSRSSSFVLHGRLPLSTYQDDEYSARKISRGPLIANNAVRHRLLSAKDTPPGRLDLEVVARLVEEALGKKTPQPDITSRSWYCFPKEYILDIVSVFALVQARSDYLEIDGVGDRIDLSEEDTLGRIPVQFTRPSSAYGIPFSSFCTSQDLAQLCIMPPPPPKDEENKDPSLHQDPPNLNKKKKKKSRPKKRQGESVPTEKGGGEFTPGFSHLLDTSLEYDESKDKPVEKRWDESGLFLGPNRGASGYYNPKEVFIGRRSLDSERDFSEKEKARYAHVGQPHTRTQSASGTLLPNMPPPDSSAPGAGLDAPVVDPNAPVVDPNEVTEKIDEVFKKHTLPETAASIVQYIHSDHCPYSLSDKRALYDAILQHSVVAINPTPVPSNDPAKPLRFKSNFAETFHRLCKLEKEDLESALEDSADLLATLYQALCDDTERTHNLRRAFIEQSRSMTSLNSTVTRLLTTIEKKESEFKAMLAEQKAAHDAALEKEKAEHEAALAKEKAAHGAALKEEKAQHAEELVNVKLSLVDTINVEFKRRDALAVPLSESAATRQRQEDEMRHQQELMVAQGKLAELEGRLQASRTTQYKLINASSEYATLERAVNTSILRIEKLETEAATAKSLVTTHATKIKKLEKEKGTLECTVKKLKNDGEVEAGKAKQLAKRVESLETELIETNEELTKTRGELANATSGAAFAQLSARVSELVQLVDIQQQALLGNKKALGIIQNRVVLDQLIVDIGVVAGIVKEKTNEELLEMKPFEYNDYIWNLNNALSRNASFERQVDVFGLAVARVRHYDQDDSLRAFDELFTEANVCEAFDVIMSRASETRFNANDQVHQVPENYQPEASEDLIGITVPGEEIRISKVIYRTFNRHRTLAHRLQLGEISTTQGKASVEYYKEDKPKEKRHDMLKAAIDEHLKKIKEHEANLLARAAASDDGDDDDDDDDDSDDDDDDDSEDDSDDDDPNPNPNPNH